MNQQLILENKFLHEFLNFYYSTNYINYRSSDFFFLVIINYKYNNFLNITLIFIITVKLL